MVATLPLHQARAERKVARRRARQSPAAGFASLGQAASVSLNHGEVKAASTPQAECEMEATKRSAACLVAQPCTLVDVIFEVPRLLEHLPSSAWSALSGCCKQLQHNIHSVTQTVHITKLTDLKSLSTGNWPQLSMVMLNDFSSLPLYRYHASGSLQLLALFELSISTCTQKHSILLAVNQQATQPSAITVVKLPTPVMAYLRQPEWSQLQRLALRDSKLSADGLAELVSIQWPHLSDLDVSNNQLGAAGAAQLAKGAWPELRILNVSNTQLNTEALMLLTEARWPLQKLDLGQNPMLGNASMAVLATDSWSRMSKLHLDQNNIDVACMRELVQLHWTQLEALDLYSSRLTAVALEEFATGNWPCLASLQLNNNNLGCDAVAALVTASLPALCDLSLSHNDLDATAMQHMVDSAWPRLARLRLNNNSLDDMAMLHLAQCHWPQLKELQLGQSTLSLLGVNCLVRGGWPNLMRVQLDSSAISAETWALLGLNFDDLPDVDQYTRFTSVTASRQMDQQHLFWPALHTVSFVSSLASLFRC